LWLEDFYNPTHLQWAGTLAATGKSCSPKSFPENPAGLYLLVAPGKHGADDLVASFYGKHVRLQGQLIYREGGTMVEITPGSIVVTGTAPTVQETTRDLGTVTVTGEIVDSKCYLEVMNPGQGKVHRDCAARCLSGGIPPIFVTTDPVTTDGREQFLLVGLDGRALGRDTLRPPAALGVRPCPAQRECSVAQIAGLQTQVFQ